MPNHITNVLAAPKDVLNFMKSKDSEFDFNNILPMPEILRGHQPHASLIDAAKFSMGLYTINDLRVDHGNPDDSFRRQDFGKAADSLHQSNVLRWLQQGPYPKDYKDDEFEEFVNCCRAINTTGYTYWLDWANDNWGTKWNAYKVDRCAETSVKFQTAWSTPMSLVVKLSERFPDATLQLKWADEDFGCNVGDIQISPDGIRGGKLKNNSPEAKELALTLIYNGEIPEYMKRDPAGELVYAEDEE